MSEQKVFFKCLEKKHSLSLSFKQTQIILNLCHNIHPTINGAVPKNSQLQGKKGELTQNFGEEVDKSQFEIESRLDFTKVL